jgi:hypothetical protein
MARLNAEGDILDRRSIVPLDAGSLIDTACANLGLRDFGDDGWREHFDMLVRAIEEEADLHFLGRLYTRSDLLIYLQSRLQVTDWYKRHPEIEDEQITAPVFIIGLGRSGTTILHEALAQDEQFRFVNKWEALFPCPPPEEHSYRSDPRIQRAHDLITLQDRIAPEWKAKHAVGGDLPVECVEFTHACFASELFTASFQIPSYEAYLGKLDFADYYRWHRRLIKLLQWRYKRKHWLFKGANHLPFIPELLQVYPDAKIISPARDPIITVASIVSVLGTIYSFRTDKPFSSNTYEKWMRVDTVAAMLNRLVDWVEDGTLGRGNFASIRYAQFASEPIEAVRGVYADLALDFTPQTQQRMRDYLATKPKAVFGAHSYAVGEREVIEQERKLLTRYQSYFDVPSEI